MTGQEEVFRKFMSEGHSAAWDQDWEKAVVAYQSALDEIPDDPKALNSLGMVLFELQRLDESLQAYQLAARAAPDDPLPHERIA